MIRFSDACYILHIAHAHAAMARIVHSHVLLSKYSYTHVLLPIHFLARVRIHTSFLLPVSSCTTSVVGWSNQFCRTTEEYVVCKNHIMIKYWKYQCTNSITNMREYTRTYTHVHTVEMAVAVGRSTQLQHGANESEHHGRGRETTKAACA